MLPARPLDPPDATLSAATPAASAVTVRRLLKPALMLLALLAAGLLLRLLPAAHGGVLPAVELLRQGVRGRLLFLLAGTLVCALGLPRQAVCFAGGLAYGLAAGTALSSLATVAGCLLGFLWARLAGRGWVLRRLQTRAAGFLARLDRLVQARPFGAILTVRLLPVGSSLALNLAAGALGVGFAPFALATLLGSLPQTVIFTLLGGGARIGHGFQVLFAAALFAASGLAGLALMRRQARNDGPGG